MIDLQVGCIRYLEERDAAAYLDHMGHVLKDIRTRDVPVGWVTIGKGKNDLHMPTMDDTTRRSHEELLGLGFFEGGKNAALFTKFMHEHGPRKDELVFCKQGFSAFDAGEPALNDYLKERMVERADLFGGMACYCVASTARDAAHLRYQTNIAVDSIIGWHGGALSGERMEGGGATWRGENHAARIKAHFPGIADQVGFEPASKVFGSHNAPGRPPSAVRFDMP